LFWPRDDQRRDINGGRGSSPTCEVEGNVNITTMFYDIQISAADAAGNVGTDTSSVIVASEKEDEIIEKNRKLCHYAKPRRP
jgi:hypothetical protein